MSSEHSNREPGSLEPNVKLALVAAVGPDGPESIDVSGGVVSVTTVHATASGVGSTSPFTTARAENVCTPGVRPP